MSHVVGEVVVERVVMLFVVMLGSQNTEEAPFVVTVTHPVYYVRLVLQEHSIFHKGPYLSSFMYEVSGSFS